MCFWIIKFNDNREYQFILQDLENNNLIKRLDTGYDITFAGGILLAKDFKDFDLFASKEIRINVYDGIDKNKTKLSKDGKKGYAVGFDNLFNYIINNYNKYEDYSSGKREEKEKYPSIAIRELIVNMFIHQDFTITGIGPRINIYDDRIEFENPGKPIIDVKDFIGQNRSRNVTINQSMRLFKICEEKGQGYDKIVLSIEENKLPPYKVVISENTTRVILFSKEYNSRMNKEDKIQACYQHCVIKNINGSSMTNESLRERLSLDKTISNSSLVTRIINNTIEKGLIIKTEDGLYKPIN